MHGRRREEYKALQSDAKVVAKLGAKAVAWHKLQDELLNRLKSSSPEVVSTLQLIQKAVTVNPDPMWLWEFRRDLIKTDSSMFDWETEASVSQSALESNPKAYAAWHHRKWSLQEKANTEIIKNELQLTELFLQRDERNFHCWSYRRFVVSILLGNHNGEWVIDDQTLMGAQLAGVADSKSTSKDDALKILQNEWDFTEAKIRQNFSNYSAFHYRSKLIKILKMDISPEFALVLDAVFTEPDDQTAWWYQGFLLEILEDTSVLASHVESLRDLKGETESKWVNLGLIQCLQKLGNCTVEERRQLLEQLVDLDPDRKHRYHDMLHNLK